MSNLELENQMLEESVEVLSDEISKLKNKIRVRDAVIVQLKDQLLSVYDKQLSDGQISHCVPGTQQAHSQPDGYAGEQECKV